MVVLLASVSREQLDQLTKDGAPVEILLIKNYCHCVLKSKIVLRIRINCTYMYNDNMTYHIHSR